MIFDPSASIPLGNLFIAEEASQRIFTFQVTPDGDLDDDDSSSTKRAGVYQRMLRHQHPTGTILYSSVFNEGRVDALRLDEDGHSGKNHVQCMTTIANDGAGALDRALDHSLDGDCFLLQVDLAGASA